MGYLQAKSLAKSYGLQSMVSRFWKVLFWVGCDSVMIKIKIADEDKSELDVQHRAIA